MTDEQRIYELAAALLELAIWYEGNVGDIDPIDHVRTYLGNFPAGQRVLKENEDGWLRSRRSTILHQESEKK